MSIFDSMEVLASGLQAEQVRLDITNSNMVNAKTTQTEAGGPYRRKDPIFASAEMAGGFGGSLSEALTGVSVHDIQEDQRAPRKVYDPSHPHADKDGYVGMPNISAIEEMANMLSATRSYEAQLNAMHGNVQMAEKALSLGK